MDALSEMDQMVSIIIPAFNREQAIGQAITSVKGSVAESYEVIVVDDGSSDETAARAQDALNAAHPGAGRVLLQANAGPGAARNAGAKVAQGRYLAFLDSDDFWLPATLDAVLEVIDREEPALIFLQAHYFTKAEEVEERSDAPPSIRRFDGFLEAVEAVPTTIYGSGTVVVRRDIYEALGGFTTEVRCSEDTDFFLRAGASGSCFILLGTPLVAVDGAGDGLTGNFLQVLAGYEFLLRRECQGHYPDAPTGKWLKDTMLGKCAAHTVQAAFAAGHSRVAYRTYFQSIPRLLRARNWHWLIRLPLVPLLAFLRPSSYRMRWTVSD